MWCFTGNIFSTIIYCIVSASDIDDCASSPCVGHSDCIDQLNNYTCVCHPGYTGEECDTGTIVISGGSSFISCYYYVIYSPSFSTLSNWHCHYYLIYLSVLSPSLHLPTTLVISFVYFAYPCIIDLYFLSLISLAHYSLQKSQSLHYLTYSLVLLLIFHLCIAM